MGNNVQGIRIHYFRAIRFPIFVLKNDHIFSVYTKAKERKYIA